MPTPRTDSNGHRRRQVRRRVLAEENYCALCREPVDKTITYTPGGHGPNCTGGTCTGCIPDPRRPEVDENIPRSRGGSPYDRANCSLMHRSCNQEKGALTLEEALARRASKQTIQKIQASGIW